MLAGYGAIPGQVPLVMGLWGPKGAGKTFSLELALRRVGAAPVCLSAGELEDEWAGEPGRRLRERYAHAVRHAEQTGQLSCLVISDIDIGVGTFEHTRNTVNTQILQGSLMALCDDPSLVSTGQAWAAVRRRPLRLPIFVTANDLGCLYAPLVRDGRMDKLYWEPTRAEMAGMLAHAFAPDLSRADVEALLAAFPRQPMDFFGAVKARLADAGVRAWLDANGGAGALAAAVRASSGGGRAAIAPSAPPVTLEAALAAAAEIAAEQQAVLDLQLAKQYMPGLDDSAEALAAREERRLRRRRRARPPRRAAEAGASQAAELAARERAAMAEGLSAYWDKLAASSWVSSSDDDGGEEAASGSGDAEGDGSSGAAAAADAADVLAAAAAAAAAASSSSSSSSSSSTSAAGPDAAAAPAAAGPASAAAAASTSAAAAAAAASAWPPGVSPDQLAETLRRGTAAVVDMRTARDHEWGRVKGSVHCGFFVAKGSSLNPTLEPNPSFVDDVARAVKGDRARPVVLYGPGAPPSADADAVFVSKELFVSTATSAVPEEAVEQAAAALRDAGFAAVARLDGGYRAWDLAYRPDGRRRAKGNFRDTSSGDLEWWTASN